jgi:aspartate ammonia-lyase
VLGYETATEIAKEALATGRGVYDLVCDRGLMTREELDRVLDPRYMLGLDQHAVPGATTEYSVVNDGSRRP